MKKLHIVLLALLVLVLAACGDAQGSTTSATSTSQAVNGFGIGQNHVHSLVILPDAQQTILMATHYGIYRSQDHGATWQETAGGPNQLMQGLMTYGLSYNPLNPQRIYVLTQVSAVPHAGTLGFYTSSDGGKTWQMTVTTASLTSSYIYASQAGNDSPDEVYIYLSALGPNGLKVSKDNGYHFAQAGNSLPFGSIITLLPLPGKPGHLLVYGNEGAALSSDGGAHWQVIKSLQDSIFEMTTSGPNQPIYARGGAGIYVSHDNGQSFTQVTTRSYASLAVSPQQPNVIYGKLAVGIFRSTDGGKTWNELPNVNGNRELMAVDLNNPDQIYLALSYPTEAYHFANNTWHSLTPPA
ncbi:MAG TPA: hypothetical protein VHD63_16065 [Ktedonobacteraceae bacterium]|nr:hypothetical protein [Ktedonobacteraceae bacterium]